MRAPDQERPPNGRCLSPVFPNQQTLAVTFWTGPCQHQTYAVQQKEPGEERIWSLFTLLPLGMKSARYAHSLSVKTLGFEAVLTEPSVGAIFYSSR
jgi:hypothetical protein